MDIFVKFWQYFSLPASQIWSCHVTQKADFGKILVFLNSSFNIRKATKAKTYWGGGKHPPVPLGLKCLFCKIKPSYTSYFGPTLYTEGVTHYLKVLEIPFKVSGNKRLVKTLYGYHSNCLIT